MCKQGFGQKALWLVCLYLLTAPGYYCSGHWEDHSPASHCSRWVGHSGAPSSLTVQCFWTRWKSVSVVQLCLTLCDLMDCSLPGSSVHGIVQASNTGVDCHALLQGIFPIQGSNLSLLHCRQIPNHIATSEALLNVMRLSLFMLHSPIFLWSVVQTQGPLVTRHDQAIVFVNQPCTLPSPHPISFSRCFSHLLDLNWNLASPQGHGFSSALSTVSCQSSHSLYFSGLGTAFLALKHNFLSRVSHHPEVHVASSVALHLCDLQIDLYDLCRTSLVTTIWQVI